MSVWQCLAIIVAILPFIYFAILSGRDGEREDAIKAGVAEWQIDPVTGEKKFVYKTLVKQDSQTNE